MVFVKVSELSGAALDWAVWRCMGLGEWEAIESFLAYHDEGAMNYSSDWKLSGPIIEREGISWHCGNKSSWHAYAYGNCDNFSGASPIIASMRCYVASKLGQSVEVPDSLL